MTRRVEEALDELVAIVESARAVPLSASCVLPRERVLELLDELRAGLPEVLADADGVLADRDDLLDRARADGARLVASARAEAGRVRAAAAAERDRLLSMSEMYRAAVAEAEQVLARADDRATQRRAEVDDYVDARLAAFAQVLQWTLRRVERGRETLRGGAPSPAAPADQGPGDRSAKGSTPEQRSGSLDRRPP